MHCFAVNLLFTGAEDKDLDDILADLMKLEQDTKEQLAATGDHSNIDELPR